MNPTPEQIKAMPAGKELDAVVHKLWHPEDVIEWRWCAPIHKDALVFKELESYWGLGSPPNEGIEEYAKRQGFRKLPCVRPGDKYSWQPILAYSTDGNAMGALKDRMFKSGFTTQTFNDFDDEDKPAFYVSCGKDSMHLTMTMCKTEPEAVAKAAALAKLPKKMTEKELGELEYEFAGWEDSGTTGAIEI